MKKYLGPLLAVLAGFIDLCGMIEYDLQKLGVGAVGAGDVEQTVLAAMSGRTGAGAGNT